MRLTARNDRHATRTSHRGAAIVEFALVVTIFLMLLLGIMDFGRWLYTLNAASEATRLGARVAVVCDINDSAIKERMRRILPQAADANITITYYGSDPNSPGNWVNGCTIGTCAGVNVRLTDFKIEGIAWFLPVELPIPPFSTSLVRESLLSAIDGSSSPVCQ